jgi:hypothetical protein
VQLAAADKITTALLSPYFRSSCCAPCWSNKAKLDTFSKGEAIADKGNMNSKKTCPKLATNLFIL